MADIDTTEMAWLAFSAHGEPPAQSGRAPAGGEAGRERLAKLADAVDETSYRRYIAIRAALCVAMLTVGIIAILLLVAFMPAAAIEVGLIDPLALADNIAFLIVIPVLAALAALAVTIAATLIAPRLAAAWSAGSAMRAKLVAQPGDAALVSELEHDAARPLLLGLPVLLGIALMLLWLAMANGMPKTEWLILTLVLLSMPLIALSLRRMTGRKLKTLGPH